MPIRYALILLVPVMVLSGCARRGPVATTPAAITDPALLPLDQIEPRPVLPKPAQATTEEKPSLEVVELYARARGAMLDRQRRTAVSLLEKAIELDPHSFELHYALGRAQSTNRGPSERAIASYLKAAEINPDHVELHSELGRQYMLQDEIDKSIHHLRLALLTSGYQKEEDQAAIVDLRLARALQQKGYDRASLDAYTRLLNRLQRATSIVRGHPELMYLATRPEVLYVEIGQLYERREQYEQALAAYDAVAAHAPGFEPQARVVRTLLKMGRRDDARNRAIALLRETRAGPDAMQLLREVYAGLGNEAGAADALRKLYDENPSDTIMLFALADSLEAAGKPQQAEAMLQRALDQQSPRSIGVIRRLFSLYESRRDTPAAVRLLIESMAADHRANFELLDLWERLLHGLGGRMLRLADVERVDVAPEAQGAKLYWTARIAGIWGRESIARTALEQAVEQPPPYAPAFRELIDQIWLRDDFDDAQKQAESQELIDRAEQSGAAALAAELRGRALMHQKKPNEAVEILAPVAADDDASPETILSYAAALRADGNTQKFEQVLWKLASDYPSYPAAYTTLFGYYIEQGAGNQAIKVLTSWLSADPQNVNARLLQATVLAQTDQLEPAEAILLDLFATHSDSPEVIASMRAFYTGTDRLPKFIELLEAQREKEPANRAVVENLLDIYRSQEDLTKASRLIDATRAAVADDPEQLYYVAGLYMRIDQPLMSEKALLQVLELDPEHPPAANDLGYTWADQGRNLQRAESLIRVAVEAEPDNESFLDSLGWVLYKRGDFAQARKYLEQAIAPVSQPDPVSLDHLGDTLYRLDEPHEAQKLWRRAMERLEQMNPSRRDLVNLRDQLQEKLRQAEGGQPVSVAPIAE